MRKHSPVHITLLLLLTCGLVLSTHAQGLSPTAAPAQNWAALACSADGSTVAAAATYGWLYVSTNSGVSWNLETTSATALEPERPWVGVACSADGTRIAAVANFNPILVSTNAGQTFHESGPAAVWSSIAMSRDGMQLVAVDYQGVIYVSKDGAMSWTATAAPVRRWRATGSSANGATLYAASDYGTNYSELPAIFSSTNSGATWRLTSAPTEPWQSIACSADGQKVAAAPYGGVIHLSADSGKTWTPTTLPALHWGGIASSIDGTRLIAASEEGMIYVSNNSGRSWNKASAPNANWLPITCSSDGLKVFAGIWDVSTGGIYAAELPPVLNIAVSAQGTVVSWPSPSKGYGLQRSADMLSWTLVGTAPEVLNGQNQVRFSAANNANFRLVRAD